MKLPNFFVVGAAKAGTTSLYHYLEQHPDIYMSPIKEPNYFAKDININLFREDYKKLSVIDTKKYFSKPKLEKIHFAFITELDDYVQLFREVKNEKIVGEMSNSYLYSKVAAMEIKKLVPDAKIIMMLRDPVERAYSHYLMNFREGLTLERDFIKEILSDFKKPRKGWGISHLYIELGLYYEQVKRYFDVFPRENIKVVLYDDYKSNPKEVIKEIFEFLEVDSNFIPDLSRKYNVSAVPKYPRINKLTKNIYIMFRDFIPKQLRDPLKETYKLLFQKREKRKLSNKERRMLLEYFRDDIKKLSKLINKDLTRWMA